MCTCKEHRPYGDTDYFTQVEGPPNCKPNYAIVSRLLSVVAQVGNLDFWEWVLEYIKFKGSKGNMWSDKILVMAFIDMYSKYRSLEKAKELFGIEIGKFF